MITFSKSDQVHRSFVPWQLFRSQLCYSAFLPCCSSQTFNLSKRVHQWQRPFSSLSSRNVCHYTEQSWRHTYNRLAADQFLDKNFKEIALRTERVLQNDSVYCHNTDLQLPLTNKLFENMRQLTYVTNQRRNGVRLVGRRTRKEYTAPPPSFNHLISMYPGGDIFSHQHGKIYRNSDRIAHQILYKHSFWWDVDFWNPHIHVR